MNIEIYIHDYLTDIWCFQLANDHVWITSHDKEPITSVVRQTISLATDWSDGWLEINPNERRPSGMG